MTYWGDDAEDKVAVWKSFEGSTLECSGGSDQTEKSHGCQNFERINCEMTCTKISTKGSKQKSIQIKIKSHLKFCKRKKLDCAG